jgi:CCR4-NOT transcriptional regulation complex NOT5 subunit
MKKIYKLTDEKKHEDRVLEAAKNDIRKYVKREKNKDLADKKTMYWDFDCKIGASEASAKIVVFESLTKELDEIKSTGASECYVEILAKAVHKPLKEEEAEAN